MSSFSLYCATTFELSWPSKEAGLARLTDSCLKANAEKISFYFKFWQLLVLEHRLRRLILTLDRFILDRKFWRPQCSLHELSLTFSCSLEPQWSWKCLTVERIRFFKLGRVGFNVIGFRNQRCFIRSFGFRWDEINRDEQMSELMFEITLKIRSIVLILIDFFDK